MTGEEKTDKNRRRYIRIEDDDYWKKIEKIMTAPKYAKSFNKVINDALYYGLDALQNTIFEAVEEITADTIAVKTVIRDGANEEYFNRIIKLLKEVILNETFNKSILCSLFNVKSYELKGELIKTAFDEGSFRDTPEYLIPYEFRTLQDLRKS